MSRRAHADEEGDDLEVIDLDAPGAIDRPPAFERYRIDGDGGLEPDEAPRRPWSRRRIIVVAVVVAIVGATTGVFAATRDGKRARDVTLDVPTTARGRTTFTEAAAAPIAVGPTVTGLLTGQIVIAGDDGARVVRPNLATATPIVGTETGGRVVDRNGQLVRVEHGNEQSIVDLTDRRPTVTRHDVTVFPAGSRSDFWIVDERTLSAAYGPTTYRLPPNLNPIAQVNGGFLVRLSAGRFGVWDPQTRTTRTLPGTFDDIIATRPDRIAWLGTDCGELLCPIHLTDIATGTDAVVASPFSPADELGRSNGTRGRFSPDGRYLAIVTPLRNGASGGLALVDVATGSARRLITLFGSGDIGRSSAAPDALPFDWTPDGKALLALERSDSNNASRLARVDPASGGFAISGDALPASDALVSVGVPPPAKTSPPLPAARPLLGSPSGTTVLNVSGNEIQRLDLDTGRVTTEVLGPPPDRVPGGNDAIAPSLIPMRNGALLTNLFGSFWIPRTGVIRVLDNNSANNAISESRDRAWIVKVPDPTDPQNVQLIPVDGRTGATGPPITAFTQPAGAVSRGFVDYVGPRIDAPGYVDVWDPVTRAHHKIEAQIMERDTTAVLAAGDRIVWSTACDEVQQQSQCGLYVVDVVTGAVRELGDWTTRGVSMSPDGTAVVFNPVAGAGAGSLQYVDLATGARTPLPQASTYGTTVWGPNGWVFYNADNIDGLAAWRPGMKAPIGLAGVSSSLETAAAF